MRRIVTTVMIGSAVLLAGCQFETKAAPVAMKVGLYAPEKMESPAKTTVSVEIEHPDNVDEVHVQVTLYGSEETETFETTHRKGHYVSSIPFKQTGIYVVNGMVHSGEAVYTPKTLVRVGKVSDADFEDAQASFQSNVSTSSGHGQHHH